MERPARILVVDDEVRLAGLIAEALRRAGYDPVVAHDGVTGLAKATAGGIDLVILDIMIPGLSGYRVLERMRAEGLDVPVIMLTAKDGEYDQLDALELGADDYVTKPFSVKILLARVAILLRRDSKGTSAMTISGLRLDERQHRVWIDEVEVTLTAMEFSLLAFLMARAGEPVPKSELLQQVWRDEHADPNLVEVCIGGLRRKVGPSRIETLRNVGYRLVAESPQP